MISALDMTENKLVDSGWYLGFSRPGLAPINDRFIAHAAAAAIGEPKKARHHNCAQIDWASV
jgi:hypothetical protein